VQCPAVRTTVDEISVPEQRNLPSGRVKRTTPTLVWTVSGPPPVMARAGAVVRIAAPIVATAAATSRGLLVMVSPPRQDPGGGLAA
jgi:hypothetical protein